MGVAEQVEGAVSPAGFEIGTFAVLKAAVVPMADFSKIARKKCTIHLCLRS